MAKKKEDKQNTDFEINEQKQSESSINLKTPKLSAKKTKKTPAKSKIEDASDILEVTENSEPDKDLLISEEEKSKSLELAMLCVNIGDSMKAEDIKVLDVTQRTTIADYFVLMTGFNRKQIQGIAYEIEKAVKKQKLKIYGIEGFDSSWWILMDLNTVIVHIFYEDARKYYELDTLWADSKVVHPKQNK